MTAKKIQKIDSEEMVVLSIKLQQKYVDAIELYLESLPNNTGKTLRKSDAARALLILALKQQKILK